MRKSLLLAVALSCVSASALQAQAIFDRAWGAKAGVSIAGASGDLGDVFDKGNQTGFAAGLFAHNYWGLFGGQLEASYLQKGASLEGPSVLGSNEYSVDYLELAALLKLGIPLGIVRPGIFGGIGFDIKLSCDEPSGLPDWSCDNVKGTDWAGILGGDVGLYFGSFMVFADARYNIGLSEFNDSETYKNLKNKGWTVQGGIGFEIN